MKYSEVISADGTLAVTPGTKLLVVELEADADYKVTLASPAKVGGQLRTTLAIVERKAAPSPSKEETVTEEAPIAPEKTVSSSRGTTVTTVDWQKFKEEGGRGSFVVPDVKRPEQPQAPASNEAAAGGGGVEPPIGSEDLEEEAAKPVARKRGK